MTLIKFPFPSDTGPSNRRPSADPFPDPLNLASVNAADDRMRSALALREQRTGMLPEVDIWPDDPLYGRDHGRQTSQLAAHLALVIRLPPRDVEVVKLAGYLHDVGRRMPWRVDDPYHADRGAALAATILAAHPFRDEVCRLIAGHKYGPGPDPRAGCLHDADLYEGARLMPNTADGRREAQARFLRVRLEWSKAPEHQARWMTYRGWKLN